MCKGKSTLLRLLALLDPLPSAAQMYSQIPVLVGGLDPPVWRSEIMYVSQSRVTRTGSPRDLFEMATSFKSQLSRTASHRSLDDVANSIGITNDMLDQAWATLSGGQAQRALIAVCVALNPRVLLLDEPTSALDHASAETVEKELASINGLTCVWVSHDPNQVSRHKNAAVFSFPNQREIFSEEDDEKSLLIKSPSDTKPLAKKEKSEESKSKKVKKNDSFLQKYGYPLVFTIIVIAVLVWEGFDGPGYQYLVSNNAAKGATPISVPLIGGSYAALATLVICLSQYWSLGIESDIITAASRCILQLTFLGFLLVPIFKIDSPFLVLGFLSLSTFVSSLEAIKRCKYGYPRMALHVLIGISVAVAAIASAGLTALGEGLNAQYSIPMCGMLFGNSMTGCALSLNTLMTEMVEQARNTELLLSLGATRWEAIREQISRAISIGATPTIQSMAVIGLVSIPGMMTGQILGGTVPEQAARYQMMITFYITMSSMISMMISTVFAATSILDSNHCVRLDKVKSRKKGEITWKLVLTG
jgi:putative ABC transport system permease protein